MSLKINKLEIENVKRVKAVRMKPSENGLTVIGGKNAQGKTSVLDAIAWGLGGEKYRPSKPDREGSTIPPSLKITMNNGLTVERKGKNSSLKVTDPSGEKDGQKLLDSFISELALDLPKFLNMSCKEKATVLLKIIGVGDKLIELEQKEKTLYNDRTAIGRIADQKKKYAAEQPYYPDAPNEPISASELISQQQEILARNGENQKKRENLARLEEQYERQIKYRNELEHQLAELKEEIEETERDLETAKKTAAELIDESTEELEESLRNIEEINVKVRANLDKEKAEEDAKIHEKQYNELTDEIEAVRKEKIDLLSGADLPLPDLSIEDGEIVYRGQKWDCMSSSEQMKVATAIVRKLNPECGFVLLDRLEQMDVDTMNEFGAWLESEGLQAIATRVSTGKDGECSIIIEDGYVVGGTEKEEKKEEPQKKWKEGTF